MGGAADNLERASSPLKRRASDLEEPTPAEDVQMGEATQTDSQDEVVTTTTGGGQDARDSSVDMLVDESHQQMEQSLGASQISSIEDQISEITRLCEEYEAVPLKEGQYAYLISQKWLNRVLARAPGARPSHDADIEGEVGPVDNSDLIQEQLTDLDGNDFAVLKPGLVGGESFRYMPKEAWDKIVSWHGLKSGQFHIERRAVNTNEDFTGLPNIQYELHPLVFKVHRLWSQISPIPLPQIMKAKPPPPPVFIASRSDNWNELLKRMKKATEIDISRKVQIWKTVRQLPASVPGEEHIRLTPPASRPDSPASGADPGQSLEPQDSWASLLLDVESFVKLTRDEQRQKIDIPDNTNNANYNGRTTVGFAGVSSDESLVLDEQIARDEFVSNFNPKNSKTALSGPRNNVSSVSIRSAGSNNNSGRNSPAPSGPNTRGRAQRSGRVQGCVGLANLGNTCYMNSALQCVRSVEELTKYFLSGTAKDEINYENILGNRGEVALAYGHLLHEIYRDGAPTSIAPRNFKSVIGRHAPSFSGYGQQDSQEFLGFLLDGLQEDLSRVKKKPYIEKPDSTDDMVGNQEKIREMAAQVWDITKRRDDSVIADLFTGMYKSTVVCPDCQKVSITFDPFNNLTLQLPIENTWQHLVVYFPLSDRPVRILVDIDKQASIKTLKEFISKRVGVPASRLAIADTFTHTFYKMLEDNKVASEEIQESDETHVYELETVPTNWPVPKEFLRGKPSANLSNNNPLVDVPQWNHPLAEKMLVAVCHRRPGQNSRHAMQMMGTPHFIVVTPDEARNEDILRRKILEKVATFTTFEELQPEDEGVEDSADNVDPDLVVTNASDADSAGDAKVVAHSVDGEEDVVDVTMKDSVDAKPREQSEAPTPSKKHRFRTRRPRWIDPLEYLDPKLQGLFELCYATSQDEMVPGGWNSCTKQDVHFPSLASRLPRTPRVTAEDRPDTYGQPGSRKGSLGASDASTEEDNTPAPISRTRMTEESDESDDGLPALKDLGASSHMMRRKFSKPLKPKNFYSRKKAGIKTYGKKGAKYRSRADSGLSCEDESIDEIPDEEGPLIRLGEYIVVDWSEKAAEALFDGDGRDNSFQGAPTYPVKDKNRGVEVPTLPDPELDAKRRRRTNRRNKGITLDDCLDEFGKEEILSEQDTWYCPRCKEHRRASKKFELWKTPDILVMHLKRFSSSGYRRDKVDVHVDFPIEGLDLSSRVIERQDGKEDIYDLFAVDDHWGGLGGGHYTAFAKNFYDGEWYEYNDSSVSKLKDPQKRVVSAAAYLLFYRRRLEVPLGGPRLHEIIERYDRRSDSTESGEDQRLGTDSSRHGSSSALTGVAAAHRAGGVSESAGEIMTTTTVNPADLEQPPSYSDALGQEDGAPLIAGDAEMNDGLQVRQSVEMDEAIDMGPADAWVNPNFQNTEWDFSALSANGGSSHLNSLNSPERSSFNNMPASSDGSNDVNYDSSDDEAKRDARHREFQQAEAEEYEEGSPVPDLSEEVAPVNREMVFQLHNRLEDVVQHHRPEDMSPVEMDVTAESNTGDGDDDEPAAEIHVDEGEGL